MTALAITVVAVALFLLLRRIREKYSQPSTNYYQTKQGDRVCGDLQYTRGPSLEQCKQKCDAMGNCIGISWHPHRHCWQKGSAGTKHCRAPLSLGHHPNGYQFYYKNIDGFHAQNAGDRVGGNIGGYKPKTVAQCADICKKQGDCIGFSYYSPAMYCITKRDKGLSTDYHMNGWQYFARNDRNNNRGDAGTTIKYTPHNHWGGGNTVFLDRHSVDCETEGLQGFRLVRPRWNRLAYYYQCSKNADYKHRFGKATGWNAEGGGRSVYLDRHDVNCGAHALTHFHLRRRGNGQYRYNYTCSRGRHSGKCRGTATRWNSEGDHKNIYLDRHHARCGNHEVMTRFKLNRRGNGTFRYDYTCCKI